MTEPNEEREGLLEEREQAYVHPPTDAKSQGDIDAVSETPLWPLNVKEFLYITYTLLKAGIPSSFAFAASILRALVSLVLVGRYATSKELAGASLATSLGTMLIVTLAYTLDLGFMINASQLNGAGKLHEFKVLFQRQLCVLSAVLTPIIVVLSFSNYILIALNVDPEISNNTAYYFRVTIISWIATALLDFLKSFVMAQHVYFIFGMAQVISLVIHVLLCLLFVLEFDMPFTGPAIVKSISDAIGAMILLIYILRHSRMKEIISSWSQQCLHDWWPHFKQMFILGFDMFVDFVLLEFSLLIVIYINDEHVISAHSIAMNICALLFVIPFGNSMAMQSKIGNAIGENLKHKARKFAAGGLFLNLLVCLFIAAIIFIWNEDIINQMTKIPETNAILRNFLYIYNLVYFGDSFKDHLSGILKSVGKEKDVLKIYLFCNITIGFICQWVFSLVLGLGYSGIWLGLAVSFYFTCGALIMRLVTINWDKEIEGIQERLQIEEKFDEGEGL